MEPNEVLWKENNFFIILCDSMFFYKKSLEDLSEFEISSYSRASILSIIFILECAANICIQNIDGKKLFDDIDKMPFISKFDLFSRLRNNVPIDRGRIEIQKIIEVKQLRDKIAHQKPRTRILTVKESNFEKGFGGEMTLMPESDTSDILKINRNMQNWNSEDCRIIISAILDFMHYYFIDLLQMTKSETFKFLSTQVHINGGSGYMYQTTIELWMKEAQFMNVPINFIEIPKN